MLDNDDTRRIASRSVIGRIVKVMVVHLVQSMRGIEFISYRNSVLHLFLGTLAEKKAKCGNLSSLFGNVMFVTKKLWFILHFRTLETFIVGWSPMLKAVKDGSGI